MNKKILIFSFLTLLLVAILAIGGGYLYYKKKKQSRGPEAIQAQARATLYSGNVNQSAELWIESSRLGYIPEADALAISEKLLVTPVTSNQQAASAMQQIALILSSSISGNIDNVNLLRRISDLLIRQGKAANPVAWQNLGGLCTSVLAKKKDYLPARQYKALSDFYSRQWIKAPDKSVVLLGLYNDLDIPESPTNQDKEIIQVRIQSLLALAMDADKDREKASKFQKQALETAEKAATDHPDSLTFKIQNLSVQIATEKLIPAEFMVKINDLAQKTDLANCPVQELIDLGSLLKMSQRINPSQDAQITKYYQKVISLNPDNITLKADYALYLLQSEKNNEALSMIQETLNAKNPLPPLEWLERNVIRADAAYKYANYLIQKAAGTPDQKQKDDLLNTIPGLLSDAAQALTPSQLALLQAKTAFIKGNFQQAMSLADQIPPLQGAEESERLFLAAESAINLGLIGDAKDRYRKIIISQGVNFPVRLRFSQLLLQTNEYDVLENQLNSFTADEKNHPAVKEIQADFLMKKGKNLEAIKVYDDLLKVTANDQKASLLQKKAAAQSRIGNQSAALSSISEILKSNPARVEALKIFILLSNDQAACLQAVHKADQNGLPPLYSNLFKHLLGMKDWQFSKTTLSNLRGNTMSADTYEEVAKTYMIWGDSKMAMAVLDEGYKKYPSDSGLLALQLDQALATKNTEELNRILNMARENNSDGVGGAYFQAVILNAQGKADEARSVAEGITRKHPNHAEAPVLLAKLDFGKKDYANARKHLLKAIDINPANAQALSLLADIEFRNGQDDAALGYIKRALTQDPQNTIYLAQFLSIQQAKLPSESAMNIRKKIADAAPEFIENTQSLSLMLLKEGKTDEAMATANIDIINEKSPFFQRAFKAQVLAATGKTKESLDLYATLAKEKPDNLDILEKYVYLLILSGKFDEALSIIDKSQKSLNDKNLLLVEKSLAYQNKALNAPSKKEMSDALNQAIEALALHLASNESDSRSYLQLARLKLAANDSVGSILPSIDKAIKSNPNFPEAILMRSDLEFQRGKTDHAIDSIRTALKQNPDFLPYYTKLADYYQMTGQSRNTQNIIDEAIRKFPKNAQLYTMRMLYYMNNDEVNQALKDAQSAFNLSPTPQTLSNYIQTVLSSQNIPLTKQILAENDVMVKTSPLLQALQARILAMDNKPDEAFKAFLTLLQNAQNLSSAKMVVDNARISLGTDAAQKLLESGNVSLPQTEKNLLLSQLYINSGQATKAFALLAVLKDEDIKKYFPLVSSLLLSLQGSIEADKMIPEIQNLIKINPESPALSIALANLFGTVNNMDAAKKELSTIENEYPLESKFAQAEIVLNQMQKTDDAVSRDKIGYEVSLLIEQLLRSYPDNSNTYLLKARYSLLTKKNKDAVQAAEKALLLNPESGTAIMLLTGIRFDTGDKLKALGEIEFYMNKFPRNLQVRQFYGNLLLQYDKRKYAEFIDSSLRYFPKDPVFLSQKAELESAKDKKKAITYYLLALDQTPLNPMILNNLAYLLMETNQLDQAESYAKKASEIVPQDPYVLDTLGRIEFLQGRFDEAQKNLEKSLFLKPLPENAIHLAELFIKKGNKDKARDYLNQARILADKNKVFLEEIQKLESSL